MSPTWESSSPPFTHSNLLPTNDDSINEAGEEWDSREREESECWEVWEGEGGGRKMCQ